MKKQIKLNKDIGIDLEKLIEGGMVILANSGGGKSYAIRRIAEQAVPHVQVIILDPEGEFSSLRQKYDFILAGKDADVPAEPRSAALLAIKLLELEKSAVIDLYELHPQERQRFVKLFCEALVNCPKELYHPVLIILDEAHEYVPEGKPSEATWSVESLASKGRKRGQRLILASQRISKLSKNAAAECNNKLIGRASQDIDMKRAGDELGFNKEKTVELRQLKPGEFFAFGSAISDDVIKLKIGEVETAHAKVSYKGGSKIAPPSDVIKKVLAELKDLPKEAEKELKTAQELKSALSVAKRRITELEKQPGSNITKKELAEEYKRGFGEGQMSVDQQHTDELFELSSYVDLLEININENRKTMEFIMKGRPKLKPTKYTKPDPVKTINNALKTTITPHIQKVNSTPTPAQGIGKGETIMLNAIARYDEGMTTEHLAIVTGYKQTSRRVYLQKLLAYGHIRKDGDHYVATEDGISALGDSFERLPTGSELLQYWLQKLPEGEKKVLNAFVSAYPNTLTREDIQNETGYKATSTRVYVQKLLARKILQQEGSALRISNNLQD